MECLVSQRMWIDVDIGRDEFFYSKTHAAATARLVQLNEVLGHVFIV